MVRRKGFLKQLESIEKAYSSKDLREAYARLSARYRDSTQKNKTLETKEELIAYMLARMPATYGVNLSVYEELQARLPSFSPKAHLDLGAGFGAAYGALLELYPDLSSTFLEKEKKIIEEAKKLWEDTPISWESLILGKQKLTHTNRDLITASYVLSELSSNKAETVLEEVLTLAPQVFVLIETGTPKGYELILKARNIFINGGYQVIAPCSHQEKCPLTGNDWCHFSKRIERLESHKALKSADLAYEDEKYSYLIVARNPDNFEPYQGRIIKKPLKRSGHISLDICSDKGLNRQTISKKQGDSYKKAKSLKWGERIKTQL